MTNKELDLRTHKEHLCVQDGCTRWGAYGFCWPKTADTSYKWYCAEHIPEELRRKKDGDVDSANTD